MLTRDSLEVDKNDNYSWLTTAIYIAIVFVEYPINYTIQRVPIAKFLGCSIISEDYSGLHHCLELFTDHTCSLGSRSGSPRRHDKLPRDPW